MKVRREQTDKQRRAAMLNHLIMRWLGARSVSLPTHLYFKDNRNVDSDLAIRIIHATEEVDKALKKLIALLREVKHK